MNGNEDDQENSLSWDQPVTARIEVVPVTRMSWQTSLTATEQLALKAWFKHRPIAKSARQAIRLVARECRTPERTVLSIIRKANAETEAKKQREEITNAVYAAKIPTAKEVVGYSLESLAEFVKTHKPNSWEDAQRLTKIATDMQMLLRLELGQSTQNIDLVSRTQRDVNVIIQDLATNDPFVDYPALPEGKGTIDGK